MIEVRRFDDLSELYRTEMKFHSLAEVPKDIYGQMGRLIHTLDGMYRKEIELDRESPEADAARNLSRKASRLSTDILASRACKVAGLAIGDFRKSCYTDRNLPECEAELYGAVYDSLERMAKGMNKEAE